MTTKTAFHSTFQRFSLRNMRIRQRLVLVYSSLIFLSILIISVLLTVYSKQLITKKSVDYSVGILEQMGENIDLNLEQLDLASYLIFSNEDALRILKDSPNASDEDSREMEDLLVNVMFSRHDIDSIYLFDNYGSRYGTTYTYDYAPPNELIAAARKGDGKMVWMRSREREGLLQGVRIVRTKLMEPVGLLLVNMRESSITSIISKQLSEINGSVFIVNGEGSVISSLDNESSPGLDNTGLESIRRVIDRRSEGAGHFTRRIGGSGHIVTYYSSRFVDGWKYISVIPTKHLTKDVTKLLHLSIIGSLVISVLFMLLSFFVSGGISNPIKEIAFRMKRLEIEGEKPSIDYYGEDEIAYLSKSFNSMLQRIDTLIREVYEQKLLRSEQELKTLQAQINPHFLYNTLDTVNWMAISRNVPEISRIVRSLSGIMRYSISSEDEEVPIEEELKHVRDYCQIQLFRFDDRLEVVYRIDDDILDIPIPKLVLQPIVENAILHAFWGKEGRCEIVITGELSQRSVLLHIADNGKGMDCAQTCGMLEDIDKRGGSRVVDGRRGIGIRNVDRRLKLRYGSEYGLAIESTEGEGTVVAIRLPY